MGYKWWLSSHPLPGHHNIHKHKQEVNTMINKLTYHEVREIVGNALSRAARSVDRQLGVGVSEAIWPNSDIDNLVAEIMTKHDKISSRKNKQLSKGRGK